jgi:hypothetical protein
MVREHVLKGKDPNMILEEIEKLDDLGQYLTILEVLAVARSCTQRLF